jgi:hypothetical protein
MLRRLIRRLWRWWCYERHDDCVTAQWLSDHDYSKGGADGD